MTQNVPTPGVTRSGYPVTTGPTAGPPTPFQHMAGPPSPWGNPMTGQFPGVMDTLRMLGGNLGIQMQPNPPGIYQTSF